LLNSARILFLLLNTQNRFKEKDRGNAKRVAEANAVIGVKTIGKLTNAQYNENATKFEITDATT